MPPALPASVNDIYPHNRSRALNEVRQTLASEEAYSSSDLSLSCGDALALLQKMPSASVDLVLVDPPYHSTKKANIYGDADFAHDEEFLSWIDALAVQWRRVLRPNGSLYLFCSSEMAPHIYVRLEKHYKCQSIITWNKPNEPGYDGWRQKMKKSSLRRWYPHTERIVFATPAVDGNLGRSEFATFLRSCRKMCQLSSNELTERTGAYGKVNNGGAVSNWETGRNIPSRQQYQKICDVFLGTGQIEIMPEYEDVIRAFNVDPSSPFIDSWDFMNVRQYKGKHPAEKPQDMLQHIIRTSSYPGDVVLDCFSGSGSTLAAALALGRRAVGIDIEERWVNYAAQFVQDKVQTHLQRERELSVEGPTTARAALPLFAD